MCSFGSNMQTHKEIPWEMVEEKPLFFWRKSRSRGVGVPKLARDAVGRRRSITISVLTTHKLTMRSNAQTSIDYHTRDTTRTMTLSIKMIIVLRNSASKRLYQ